MADRFSGDSNKNKSVQQKNSLRGTTCHEVSKNNDLQQKIYFPRFVMRTNLSFQVLDFALSPGNDVQKRPPN